MNKTVTTTGLILLTMFVSCEREPYERDDVTGTYSGISVKSSRVDYDYFHDTIDIEMFLTKSRKDSIIIVDFYPEIFSEGFKFKYHDGSFTLLINHHPPRLTMNIDSLNFCYQPGLGPSWTECFTRKVE